MDSINTPKAALIKASHILGGQAALASALGFSDRRSVWPWFNTDRRVPAEHCPAIERATNGQVRCEELRPDVAWAVLREQAAPTPAAETAAAQG
jgi:DNA-binding transcriptional regulator YdaS (Cro superfamily)